MATLKEKIGYGFGDMSSSMFWKIFSYYLPIFYSNIYGLSLEDTGVLLLVTRIWDAVSDPMMGVIADRTQTRWGKYRPYLLWISLPFAVCGVLLFTTPDFGSTGKLVWAYITYILMMTVYTAINVPYGAMLGVMTDDSDTKTVFSSYRMFFAYGGSFIALFAWEPLCAWFKEMTGSLTVSWQYSMIVIAAFCFVIFLLCFSMTREYIKSVSTVSIGKDIKSLLANVPWWLLIGAALCSNLFSTVRGATAAYFFKDYIGDGIFLSLGDFSLLFWLMLAMQVVISVCTGIVSPLVWSMYADVSDYAELKDGTASTGLIFSSSSMAQKFGGAFGGAAVMWILAAFGYNTAEGAVQTEEALTGLNLLMSWIPAAVAVLAMIVVYFYPLTKKRVAEVDEKLKKIRAAQL